MNDITTYHQPQVSIRVTYPATDGSMPEDVTVELDGNAAGGAMAAAILRQLLDAPQQRGRVEEFQVRYDGPNPFSPDPNGADRA